MFNPAMSRLRLSVGRGYHGLCIKTQCMSYEVRRRLWREFAVCRRLQGTLKRLRASWRSRVIKPLYSRMRLCLRSGGCVLQRLHDRGAGRIEGYGAPDFVCLTDHVKKHCKLYSGGGQFGRRNDAYINFHAPLFLE